MSFKVEVGNICKIKCDVIVNSLGTEGFVYGQLCDNIIMGANSDELTTFIDSLTNQKFNTIYITDGYQLPAKNIIHVITPYKYLDKNCTQLEETYRIILDAAKKNNFKSICLPYLGTGANGYTDKEAFDALTKEVDDFLTYNPDFKIKLVIYDQSYQRRYNRKEHASIDGYNERRINKAERLIRNIRDIDYELSNCTGGFGSIDEYKSELTNEVPDEIIDVVEFNKNMQFDPNGNYYTPLYGSYSNPFLFLYEYCENNNVSIHSLVTVLDRKNVYNYKNDKRQCKKIHVLLGGYLVGMDFNMFKLYLAMFGYTLSPYNDIDYFFYQYYMGNYGKIEAFPELNHKFYDLYGDDILTYNQYAED